MKEALMEKWLYMTGMESALEMVYHSAKRFAGLSDRDHSLGEYFELTYKYAIENWKQVLGDVRPLYAGHSRPDGRFYIGVSVDILYKEVIVKNQISGMVVTIKWSEIKKFIESMINQERQISMFELLAEQAVKGA